jgi:hypothetical protein
MHFSTLFSSLLPSALFLVAWVLNATSRCRSRAFVGAVIALRLDGVTDRLQPTTRP